MKPYLYLLISFLVTSLFLLLNVGCSEIDYTSFIHSAIIRDVPDFERYDSVFIVPRTGCGSCKNLADQIVKERFHNINNLIIFTDVQSSKLLHIEIGDSILNQDNVIIDIDKHFWKQSFEESSYPVLFIRGNNDNYKFNYLLDKLYPSKME